jgi:protein-disulfide isomerase
MATVALVVALAFGAGFATGRASAPAGAPGANAASFAPVPTSVASAGAELPSDGARLGRANARVTVDYWADFQCPFCARFAQTVIPQLTSRIADGTVAIVHRDFVFIGAESLDAAVAVRCAGREARYWPMHDAVYSAQAGENKGAFTRARLTQVATSVGLDAKAFTACLDDHALVVDALDETAAGVRAGVVSTPTVDVNGSRFLGVPDVAKLLAAIDAAAAGASPAPSPTAAAPQDPWAGTATDGRQAGGASAPVTVELWMDYQATGSAAIPSTLEPELRTRIAAGAVRVVQRDFALLGEESVAAATMVRCVARQSGPAWLVHDIISGAAAGPNAGIFVPLNFLNVAARFGLQVRALDTCLADATVAADVTAETTAGKALGLTAGPVVVIRVGEREVARFPGPLDVKAVLAAIDAAK